MNEQTAQRICACSGEGSGACLVGGDRGKKGEKVGDLQTLRVYLRLGDCTLGCHLTISFQTTLTAKHDPENSPAHTFLLLLLTSLLLMLPGQQNK